MKCESAVCFKKAGLGAGFGGGGGLHKHKPEQAHLAGKKEDCQLNGGKGLGSIIMEITYSRAFPAPTPTTCSFYIGTAHGEASFQE